MTSPTQGIEYTDHAAKSSGGLGVDYNVNSDSDTFRVITRAQ